MAICIVVYILVNVIKELGHGGHAIVTHIRFDHGGCTNEYAVKNYKVDTEHIGTNERKYNNDLRNIRTSFKNVLLSEDTNTASIKQSVLQSWFIFIT